MAKPTSKKAAHTQPGTYFLSLTVENVRCFGREQTLDLSDRQGCHAQWTVLLGENGVGKTTLLSCLAAITLAGYPGEQEPKARRLLGGIDVGPLLRAGGQDGGRFGAKVVLQNGTQSIEDVEIRISRDERGITYLRPVRHSPCFQYGVSRRMPQSKSFSDDDKRVGIFLDDDVALRDPEDWLLTADYNAQLRGGKENRFDAFAKRVRQALVSILPDEVTDIRIQLADEPGGSPRVEAKTPDGWVQLRRLGFGYQSQIAWLVDFASRMFERYPDSPNPLAEPAVVLVDEIDLHMHPRWQRQVIGYLTELCPATQFIVTAHSPLVVQAAQGANIVLLRREGDHVVIDNDPEVLDNWRVDQILTSGLFGLESARPPQIEKQLQERRALLAKPKLTNRDRGRLAKLEAEIGDLPAGENAEDRRAMDLIREIAGKLKSGA